MSPKKLADGHGGHSGLPTAPVGHCLTGFPEVNASFLGRAVSTGMLFSWTWKGQLLALCPALPCSEVITNHRRQRRGTVSRRTMVNFLVSLDNFALWWRDEAFFFLIFIHNPSATKCVAFPLTGIQF